MGIKNLLSSRKRRLIPAIQIPMHNEALLQQMKESVAISKHLRFDPPKLIDTYFTLIEMYPLLCGLLGSLQPRDAPMFWDTYGEWLLSKATKPMPNVHSPRIGPSAHRADVHALKFATHHLWPNSFWRDKHCYRCFFKEMSARPLQLASEQCERHACQAWALRLLQDIRLQHPGFTARGLLPKRGSEIKSSKRKSTAGKSRKSKRRTDSKAVDKTQNDKRQSESQNDNIHAKNFEELEISDVF